MSWELCIRYANGKERVLKAYKSLETAETFVDRIYQAKGYPMHYAYCIRPSCAA
ncbi:MAG: family 2 glycosyl transferase [Cyanobacteria bacterium P01_H01_bin.119]